MEVRNKQNGDLLIIKAAGDESVTDTGSDDSLVNNILLVKDKYSISNAAYHELSMTEKSLPRSCRINKQAKDINQKWAVTKTPEGTVGVQISLKNKLCERVEHLVNVSP